MRKTGYIAIASGVMTAFSAGLLLGGIAAAGTDDDTRALKHAVATRAAAPEYDEAATRAYARGALFLGATIALPCFSVMTCALVGICLASKRQQSAHTQQGRNPNQ